MPDSKITALTALTAADPAVDMFPVVDVSDTTMAASGTTKRISINNILACSPAATLASLNVTGSSIPANGLYLPTTNTLEFAANSLAQYRIAPLGVFSWYDGAGGTRMTLNANGLGIGVTPSAWTSRAIQIGAGGSGISTVNGTEIVSNAYYSSGTWNRILTATASWYSAEQSGAHKWYNAGSGSAGTAITWTQAMTLTAAGDLLVGVTAAPSGAIGGSGFIADSNSRKQLHLATTASTSQVLAVFINPNGTVGTIETNGSSTAYNISSDYRLKEEVKPLTGALNRITALKPSTYKWKVDGSVGEGFIAHELAEVVPFAVSGQKDAVNADGSMKTQGVDLSKIIPILVAAVQELTARVQTLEAK